MPHPVTRGSFVRLSKFPLLSPRPESGFTDSLQIVGSEGQFGRRRRHGPEETRQQCIENSREHVDDEAHNSLIHLYISAAAAAAGPGPGSAACLVVCLSLSTFFLHFPQTAVRWQSHNTWSTRSSALVGLKKLPWHSGKCSSIIP